MFNLSRPFCDELVGSALHRSAWQLGLSYKRLMKVLSSTYGLTPSVGITQDKALAKAFGMDLEELIQYHTLLPFTVTFLNDIEKDQILRDFLKPYNKPMHAFSIVKKTIKTMTWLHFCPMCNIENLQRYGVAYWRRAHQLPGVLVCDIHGTLLYKSEVSIYEKGSLPPPDKASGCLVSGFGLSAQILQSIASTSVSVLNNELLIKKWPEHYSYFVITSAYCFKNPAMSRRVISVDLQSFYGEDYLQTLGLFFPLNQLHKWPTKMLLSSKKSFSPLKHILMIVFLKTKMCQLRIDVEERSLTARREISKIK
ncbi:TnsD family Tn7-like transposition protein [Advenella sp. RU8]|uniref:TnsD family Tn7-like transposition protein n=1 Tax=Advenella sp. RU8 TaxID=3399575 RepID=UPI003AAC2B10